MNRIDEIATDLARRLRLDPDFAVNVTTIRDTLIETVKESEPYTGAARVANYVRAHFGIPLDPA